MEETINVIDNDKVIILEKDQRLSQSLIWKYLRNYYEQQDMQAWSQGEVPQYVTTNPFIAQAYSDVVFGFMRDCQLFTTNSFDNSQPFYIIELGSGSGRFGYHFLKCFSETLKRSTLKEIPFKYIMTDFSMQSLEKFRAHPCLQPFIEQGVLDFACFDAEHPQDFTLLCSGVVLSKGAAAHPITILANYVFDSIPQDCFTIKEGQLFESLLTVTSSQAETDLSSPNLLSHLTFDYQDHPIAADYYDNPDFNRILQTYQERLADTTILFPYVALQCLQHFSALSGGRLLLLSGDVGYCREQDLMDHEKPKIISHGGCSWMMVNYHAIGEYFRDQGGQVLYNLQKKSSLNIFSCQLGSHPNNYLETSHAFYNAIEQWGPDDFFTLRESMKSLYETLDSWALLAYLRLSGWDSSVFLDCFPVFRKNLETASENLKYRLGKAIEQVWNMYYPIGEEQDLAFKLGSLMYAMDNYTEALNYFQHSLSLYGPDASTLYNMGLCHYYQHHWETSLKYVGQALELEPAYERARALRIKAQSKFRNE